MTDLKTPELKDPFQNDRPYLWTGASHNDKGLDEHDQAERDRRAALFALHTTPQMGDFVIFKCGTLRRISHLWECDSTFQSSDCGSFYLEKWGDNKAFMSFSGSLFHSVSLKTLTLLPEMRDGGCWFFSHNYACRDNDVAFTVPCRVWSCSEEAKS
jgi:predicted RNA-binding Zn-ribbon protein involved in translation (DUF1610 family)